MHGRKCTNCGCNYFTSKTIGLCPGAFIVEGSHVNLESQNEILVEQIEEKVVYTLEDKKDEWMIREEEGKFIVSGHAACAIVMICPVTAGQVCIGNRGAGVGGVDELAVADVNTHVGNAAAAGICEEDNVAGLSVLG